MLHSTLETEREGSTHSLEFTRMIHVTGIVAAGTAFPNVRFCLLVTVIAKEEEEKKKTNEEEEKIVSFWSSA